MGDEVVKEGLSTLWHQLDQINITWNQELDQEQSQLETLQENLLDVEASIQPSEGNELELLWRRVRSTTTLLEYLKLKASMMAVSHLGHTSCGIKHQDGIGLIDKYGTLLSDWSKNVEPSSFRSSNEEMFQLTINSIGSLDAKDGAYISEVLKSVIMVMGVIESLVKRVINAETEAATGKERVILCQEDIRKKILQIESMSAKVQEMEKFALGSICILNEMRVKVEDLVQETSRQRQRAVENEQELRHVKQDFELLRSFVSSLINVRQVLLHSEPLQSDENVLERLIGKATHLQSEKEQKEAEAQELMIENLRLNALLDKKEAQLLAMNEQCKFMALSNPGI